MLNDLWNIFILNEHKQNKNNSFCQTLTVTIFDKITNGLIKEKTGYEREIYSKDIFLLWILILSYLCLKFYFFLTT